MGAKGRLGKQIQLNNEFVPHWVPDTKLDKSTKQYFVKFT